ncbi:hypothetical protein [Streptomyces sp. NPDC058548]|uniref:hypothetical protein n=1 Tax=unclassified Streptomyces TaxID=2593676 RepID=UPI003654503D
MAKEPDEKPKPEGGFKITDEYLRQCREKIRAFLDDFAKNPYVLELREAWGEGKRNGDVGLLLPGSTADLESARALQTSFQKFCKDLSAALMMFEKSMNATYQSLGKVKQIVDDADDEAMSVANMWKVLEDIEKGFKTAAGSTSTSTA